MVKINYRPYMTPQQLLTVDINQIFNKHTLKHPNCCGDLKFNSIGRSNMHQKQNIISPQLVYDSDEINCKHLAIFCGCTAWFLSDLVINTKDRFPRDSAHMSQNNICLFIYEALVIFMGARYGRVIKAAFI